MPVRAALMVVVVVTALTASACGGGDPDRDVRAVAATVERVQRAFVDGDLAALCAELSPTARREVAAIAHGSRDTCVADLAEALTEIGTVVSPGGPTLSAVEVDGRRAHALLSLGDREIAVPLLERDGRWLVASLVGVGATHERVATRTSRGPSASPTTTAATVTDGSGIRCFPIVDAGFPALSGGCRVRFSSPSVELTVVTLLGAFRFATCEVAVTVRIDEHGRTWTDDLSVEGGLSIGRGCGDVAACSTAAGEGLPWRGVLELDRGGRPVHRTAACLETCVGRFAGDWVYELKRHGRGWKAALRDGDVGQSGLRLTGDLAADSTDLRVLRREI